MLEEERAQRAAAARRASHPQASKPRPGSGSQQQQPDSQLSQRPAQAPPPSQRGQPLGQPEPEQQPAQPQRQPMPPDSLSFDGGGGTAGLALSLDSDPANGSAVPSSSVATDSGEGGAANAGEGSELELINDDKLRWISQAGRRASESSAPQRPFHMQQAERQAGRSVPR